MGSREKNRNSYSIPYLNYHVAVQACPEEKGEAGSNFFMRDGEKTIDNNSGMKFKVEGETGDCGLLLYMSCNPTCI